ncbi:MAG TPA: SCO family protein [Gemmatimonadales bacterium]
MMRRLILLVLLSTAATAAEKPREHLEQAADAPVSRVKPTIPDLQLVDQDGGTVRFYSDLVKGKVVAINFIFTTCTSICPPLGATFARIQKVLGARMGSDLQLISVSVDPAVDTPQRLKAWSDKFHRKPGWTLVTGPKPDVDQLLAALGSETAGRADHTPMILIGNDATGTWTRAYGLGGATQVMKTIESVAARKEASR